MFQSIFNYILPRYVRRTAAPLLQHKKMIALVVLMLLASGLSLGAGLGMLLPAIQLLLVDQASLADMLRHALENKSWLMGHAPWLHDAGIHLLRMVPEDKYQGFLLVICILIVLTFLGGVTKYIETVASAWVISRVVQYWQKQLMERVCRMKLEESWRRSPQDIIGTLLFETSNLATGLNYLMGQTANALVRVIVCVAGAFAIDWKITLMAFSSAGLIGGSVALINRQIRKAIHKESEARTGMLVEAERAASNPMSVKMGCAEFRERRKFHMGTQLGRNMGFTRMKIRTLSSNINETLGVIGLCGVMAVAAYWILVSKNPDGTPGYSASTFLAVMGALVASVASLKPLSEFSNDMQMCDVSSERMLTVLDNIQTEPVSWRERKDKPKLPRLSQSIEFQNVSYTYPGKHDPAIIDLSLTIKQGEFVAIVGANGSGKSTLMLLLSRMVDPQQGQILFDDHNIASADLRSLRMQMTMVAQKTVLFQGSIMDNITYGIPWTKREAAIEASKIATADEFIMQMPGGYDMKLGPVGSGVSGGQAQRICIARAILRNPAILVLDEATSQVDPESEGRIAQAMAQITKGRTTIAIAHRLSTVLNADRIIVMDQGRIVAQGTHKELLAQSESYRSIAQTQMAG